MPKKLLNAQKIADILNVSTPYAEKLLDEGRLNFRVLENLERVVLLQDVLEYKAKRHVESEQALSELVSLAQEMGMYETAATKGS